MTNLSFYNIISEFETKRYKSEEESKLLIDIYKMEYEFVSGLSVEQEEVFQKIKGKLYELKASERKEFAKFLIDKINDGKNNEKIKINKDIKY